MDAPLVEALSDGETKVYVHRGGEYELTAQTMTADSLDSLLQTLTGFPQASLQVLQTEELRCGVDGQWRQRHGILPGGHFG